MTADAKKARAAARALIRALGHEPDHVQSFHMYPNRVRLYLWHPDGPGAGHGASTSVRLDAGQFWDGK